MFRSCTSTCPRHSKAIAKKLAERVETDFRLPASCSYPLQISPFLKASAGAIRAPRKICSFGYRRWRSSSLLKMAPSISTIISSQRRECLLTLLQHHADSTHLPCRYDIRVCSTSFDAALKLNASICSQMFSVFASLSLNFITATFEQPLPFILSMNYLLAVLRDG